MIKREDVQPVAWVNSAQLDKLAAGTNAVAVNLYREKPGHWRQTVTHVPIYASPIDSQPQWCDRVPITEPASGGDGCLPPLPVEAAGYAAGCNQLMRVGTKLFTTEQMLAYAAEAVATATRMQELRKSPPSAEIAESLNSPKTP